MKNIILGTLVLLMAVWGCEKEKAGKELVTSPLSIDISIRENGAGTRAAPVAVEDEISDINLFVYNTNGHLVTCRYLDRVSGNIEMEVFEGEKYSVYAIANVGDLTGLPQVRTSAGIEEMEWMLSDDGSMFNADGMMPLSGHEPSVEAGEGLALTLERLLAKFRVILDTASLSREVRQFDIKRIGLRNLNRNVGYFSESSAVSEEDILSAGMSYEEAQILPAFSTGLDFYLPENAMGDLLPGNLDEETHVPGQPYADLCSYIEFLVAYRSNTQYNDSLVYRYYLHDGRQSDNFDVLRNTMYTCLTRFTGNGINETSWRIDVSGMKDYVTAIGVSPAEHEFRRRDDTLRFSAFVLPLSAENKSVTWSTDDAAVATVSAEGVVTAVSDGECDLIATAADGSGVVGTAKLTVNTYVYTEGVIISPDEADMFIGEKMLMSAEVLPENSTDKSITWVSTNPAVASVNDTGEVEALSEGTCMIVVSTDDAARKDTAFVTVSPKTFGMDMDFTTLIPGYRSPVQVEYSANPQVAPSFSLETVSGNPDGAKVKDGWIYAYNPSGVSGQIGRYRLTGEAHGIIVTKDFTVDAGYVDLGSSKTVYVGIPCQLKCVSLSPSDADLTWTSSNTSLATVSSSGEVLAKQTGSVTVKAVSETGAWDEISLNIAAPQLDISDVTMYEGQTVDLNEMLSIYPECDLEIRYKVVSNSECVTVSGSDLYAAKRNTSGNMAVVQAYLRKYPSVYRNFNVLVHPAIEVSLSGDNKFVNTYGHKSDGRSYGNVRRFVTLDMSLAPDVVPVWEVRRNGYLSKDLSVSEDGNISFYSASANGKYEIIGWDQSETFRSESVFVEVYQYLDYEVGFSDISTYSMSAGTTDVRYYKISLNARWSSESWTWMSAKQHYFVKLDILGYPVTASDFNVINAFNSSSPAAYMEDWSTTIRETSAGRTNDLKAFSPKSFLRGSFSDSSAGAVTGTTGQYYKLTPSDTEISNLDGYYFIRQINEQYYNSVQWGG